MLTSSQRTKIEKSVSKEFEGKKRYFSEAFLSNKDIVVINGKEYYAILYAEFNGEESVVDIPSPGVKPLLLERSLVEAHLELSEAFRENDALAEVAFLTAVDEGDREEEVHDLVMNHYGPWDFLKLFFVSLFK